MIYSLFKSRLEQSGWDFARDTAASRKSRSDDEATLLVRWLNEPLFGPALAEKLTTAIQQLLAAMVYTFEVAIAKLEPHGWCFEGDCWMSPESISPGHFDTILCAGWLNPVRYNPANVAHLRAAGQQLLGALGGTQSPPARHVVPAGQGGLF